jgi:hypothetical protein
MWISKNSSTSTPWARRCISTFRKVCRAQKADLEDVCAKTTRFSSLLFSSLCIHLHPFFFSRRVLPCPFSTHPPTPTQILRKLPPSGNRTFADVISGDGDLSRRAGKRAKRRKGGSGEKLENNREGSGFVFLVFFLNPPSLFLGDKPTSSFGSNPCGSLGRCVCEAKGAGFVDSRFLGGF